MVRGDDMFGFAPPHVHDQIVEAYRGAGFLPKAKTGHPIELCRFCSGMFMPVGDSYVYSPTYKSILSLFLSMADISTKSASQDAAALRRGVALGLLNQCSHLPILSDLLKGILSRLPDATARSKRITASTQQEYRVRYATSIQERSVTLQQEVSASTMLRLPLTLIQTLRAQVREVANEVGVLYSPEAQLFALAVYRLECG